jgi:hypothetical protein
VSRHSTATPLFLFAKNDKIKEIVSKGMIQFERVIFIEAL